MIQCKRAYDPASPDDGKRILVDRLWPRNCRKDALVLDEWVKDVAPSTELRKAFKSGALNFAQFTRAYRQELSAQPAHWWKLLDLAEAGTLTLIYAAHDPQANNAVVLAQWLEQSWIGVQRAVRRCVIRGISRVNRDASSRHLSPRGKDRRGR
ncbi:Uncharacterized conserved protein YeaO, DUF488 family [Pseudomonas cedrina]|uniref:Uncharacterized conserved protein YeaO, DUF488 family n=1 Tax=Pseudomonas cedrina TaxID=651740 RepID=A0ABY0UMK6_PSECE|nr:DUF488 domain-containing protein [Pseudomonas cedrina]SDS91643.1 Uncharacterized conserved protein YeaO, DUF488 family [Pseudomonas cedrina]